jgi:hypothetical protein
VGGAAAHHGQTGEILAAVGAFQVAGSAILDYAVRAALDQTAATAFAVFVEQGSALCAKDGDGADVSGHSQPQ